MALAEIPSRSEEELLAKLEEWLAARDGPPTVEDIVASGDVELMAAFLLKVFRAGARDAVVDRIEHHHGPDGNRSGIANPVMRVFAGLVSVWSLSAQEQMALLDIGYPAELDRLRQASTEDVPVAVVERIAILLDIFEAINTLLPVPERADAWIRKSNTGRLFGGRSPLDLMVESHGGLLLVRQQLQAEIWSQ